MLNAMITEKRAGQVARSLFPDDIADGSDCRAEIGREGEPCRVCASRNEAWNERVAQVREAMLGAFA